MRTAPNATTYAVKRQIKRVAELTCPARSKSRMPRTANPLASAIVITKRSHGTAHESENERRCEQRQSKIGVTVHIRLVSGTANSLGDEATAPTP